MKKFFLSLNASTILARVTAFDTGKGKWKLDANGAVEMRNGNPVYIDVNGGELELGTDTVSRLNGEAKLLRIRAEKAEEQAARFEGITDPAAAKAALQTVKDIKDGDLIKKGEVEKVREEIAKTFTTQLETERKNVETLTTDLHKLTKKTAFNGSKFIGDKVAVPASLFEASFGERFKVEDGKLVAYHPTGEKVFSKTRGGELASFDEALEILVDNHPDRDNILKGGGGSGTGSQGGGGGSGGKRTVRRSEFEKLDPMQQADTAAKAQAGEINLVD